MKTCNTITRIAILGASLASVAQAGPLSIAWYSIHGGGRTTGSGGGQFTLAGTIGQPDAGVLAGPGKTCLGGFWGSTLTGVGCYANCDGSTAAPFLNVNDFVCFNNRFAAGDAGANCDASTTPPELNVNDFVCFNNKFAAGCATP